MSELLDALIAQRKQEAFDYAEYLKRVVELTKRIKNGPGGAAYPKSLDTPAKKALYDNLGKNEALALAVDAAVRASKQDDWRNNPFKVKKVMQAIKRALEDFPESITGEMKDAPAGSSSSSGAEMVLELVKQQHEY